MIDAKPEQIGNVKQVAIPAGWDPVPQAEDLFSQSWKVAFTAGDNSDVQIAFYYRGNAIDKESAETFKSVAMAKPAHTEPEKLAPNEIAALRIMLGFNNCGNNQYTNAAPPDSYDGPVFHMDVAQTKRVGDTVVLYVRGAFKSGPYFAGVFCPSDPSGVIVQEIGLQAPSKKLFESYEPVFEKMLGSIVWDS